MSTLIVTLALHTAGPATEYDYALTSDGKSLSAQGRAVAALLPSLTRRRDALVAMVPARAMSWHRVKLPQGTGKMVLAKQADQPRLRALLAGVMEEYLLDEPEKLHFAVFPGEQDDASVWVAVCNRAWLLEAVQALATLQHPVSRIVPEFAPIVRTSLSSAAYVTTGLEPAQLVLCTQDGMTVLPLGAAAVSLVMQAGPVAIQAEPSVATLAEQAFRQPAGLQTRAQRQVQAASATWDMAQFDLSVSRRSRVLKSVSRGWLRLTRESQWRPVRWGLVLLVLVHVGGLNIWAWKERSLLDAKRSAIRSLFTETFPEAKVVVDAPLQMAREVAALQQATGQLKGPGLVEILMVVAKAAPDYQPIDAIELNASEVRFNGPALPVEATEALVGKLVASGLRARVQGQLLTIELGEDS